MSVRSRILGVLMVGVLAATLSVVVGAGVAHADSAFVRIRNTHTNMCLQPQSGENFAPIVQMNCNDLQIQRWYFDKLATNHYRIVNQETGLCFNAFDGAFNGARILQVDCAPVSNEEFNTGASVPGVVKLESRVRFRDNGFCISIWGAASIEGLATVLFTCGSMLGQQWHVGG